VARAEKIADDLRAYIATRWSSIAADARADLIQEALCSAFAAHPECDDIESLPTHVSLELLVQQRYWARRRGARVATQGALDAQENVASEDPQRLTPQPRRRPSRQRRVLTGVVPTRYAAIEDLVPVTVGAVPSPGAQFMARLLRTGLLDKVERGQPCAPADLVALERFFQSVAGSSGERVWAEVLVDEMLKPKRQVLCWVRHEARSHGSAQPQPCTAPIANQTQVAFRARSGRDTATGGARPIVDVTAVLLWREGDRALVGYVGELNGTPRRLAYAPGRFVDTELELPVEPNPIAHASLALLRTIERLGTMAAPCQLPSYVVDPKLIAWLTGRLGFAGGGGRFAQLTARSMVNLLRSPSALAEEIDGYASRRFGGETVPDPLREQEFRTMADEVRLTSGAQHCSARIRATRTQGSKA